MSPKKIWFEYPWAETPPRWWNIVGIPSLSEDDYGRRVVCWGSFVTGYVYWAYRNCQCDDCVDVRAETELVHQHEQDAQIHAELRMKFSEEFADEVLARRVRLRELQKRRA